jgi:ubiquinone/menaquinone biosynthesis C-methylase UbiE
MIDIDYLMEHQDEHQRLIMKTDQQKVIRQARWAGLTEGMKAADVGCGPGVTSAALGKLSGSPSNVVGIDGSEDRIRFARSRHPKITFLKRDITQPFDELEETFDFVWVRFLLEYFKNNAESIVTNIATLLKPGGILFLADLDYNCMNHYPVPADLSSFFPRVFELVQEHQNWDPYMGRKLYSFLFDLGFESIDVSLEPHHLFWGHLSKTDEYNWSQKLDIAVKKSGFPFEKYPGGFNKIKEDTMEFLKDPRRFSYTPLIMCRGIKPETGSGK